MRIEGTSSLLRNHKRSRMKKVANINSDRLAKTFYMFLGYIKDLEQNIKPNGLGWSKLVGRRRPSKGARTPLLLTDNYQPMLSI